MNILLRIHKLKNVNITVRTKNKNVIKSIISTINSKADEKNDSSDAKLRISEVGVQMINEKLRSHLFKSKIKKDPNDIRKSQEHLASFNLNNGKLDPIKDIEYIELPKLMGQNIEEHFLNIGRKQLDKYLKLISQFANSDLPSMPKNFNFSPGWTKYDSLNNEIKKVDYPDDDALVFDVESLVLYQNCPVMAVAVSPNAWYLILKSRFGKIIFIRIENKGIHGVASV
jgi:DNA polymerase gamma 1